MPQEYPVHTTFQQVECSCLAGACQCVYICLVWAHLWFNYLHRIFCTAPRVDRLWGSFCSSVGHSM